MTVRATAAAAVPQALLCEHCPGWVRRDGQGLWVHVTGGYACRDRSGAVASTYAAPRPPPQWPLYSPGVT